MKPTWIPAGAARARPGAPLRGPLLAEVMTALVSMGWRQVEAEQAVSDLPVDDSSGRGSRSGSGSRRQSGSGRRSGAVTAAPQRQR